MQDHDRITVSLTRSEAKDLIGLAERAGRRDLWIAMLAAYHSAALERVEHARKEAAHAD